MAKKRSAGKKAQSQTGSGKPKNTGVTLEKAVARIQQMLDPNSKVTHNRKLRDHLGNVRQYDVVIEGHVNGLPFLGVAECKDHNRKKSPDAVEAFATKCKHLGANMRIIVSRLGFTRQALVVAKAEHIACLSLLPRDPDQTGLAITVTCFLRLGRWQNVEMTVNWANGDTQDLPSKSTIFDVYCDGKPIIEWFLKKLATDHAGELKPGPFQLTVKFNDAIALDIKGEKIQATGVSFTADRIFRMKRKQLALYGDGVYDWQNDTWTLPPLGEVCTSQFRGDFSGFEEVEGDIFAGDQLNEDFDFFQFALLAYDNQYNPKMEVVDLTAL